MKPLILAKFPVYCERRQHPRRKYYRAIVFRGVPEMRAFLYEQARLLEWRGRSPASGYFDHCFGCCTTWVPLPGMKQNLIGSVCLAIEHCGSGTVSHEFTHAANYYLARRCPTFNPGRNQDHDERLAWLQGWLVTQFWRGFYRHKLERYCRRRGGRRG